MQVNVMIKTSKNKPKNLDLTRKFCSRTRALTIKTVRDGEVIDEDAMTNTIEKENQQEFNTKLDENGEIVYAENRVTSGRAC